MLECLNLALDHFDQHHLDRLLKVSGQVLHRKPFTASRCDRTMMVSDFTGRFASATPRGPHLRIQ